MNGFRDMGGGVRIVSPADPTSILLLLIMEKDIMSAEVREELVMSMDDQGKHKRSADVMEECVMSLEDKEKHVRSVENNSYDKS